MSDHGGDGWNPDAIQAGRDLDEQLANEPLVRQRQSRAATMKRRQEWRKRQAELRARHFPH